MLVKEVLCLFDPMTLLFLTFYFAAVIITVATRGHQLRGSLNIGRNKLLSQSNYKVVFLMRTGCRRPKGNLMFMFVSCSNLCTYKSWLMYLICTLLWHFAFIAIPNLYVSLTDRSLAILTTAEFRGVHRNSGRSTSRRFGLRGFRSSLLLAKAFISELPIWVTALSPAADQPFQHTHIRSIAPFYFSALVQFSRPSLLGPLTV